MLSSRSRALLSFMLRSPLASAALSILLLDVEDMAVRNSFGGGSPNGLELWRLNINSRSTIMRHFIITILCVVCDVCDVRDER